MWGKCRGLDCILWCYSAERWVRSPNFGLRSFLAGGFDVGKERRVVRSTLCCSTPLQNWELFRSRTLTTDHFVGRAEKHLQAIQALARAKALDPENPELHVRTIHFKHRYGESFPSSSFVCFWCIDTNTMTQLLHHPPPFPLPLTQCSPQHLIFCSLQTFQ